jgi:type IV secretory pathway VirB3-like protein
MSTSSDMRRCCVSGLDLNHFEWFLSTLFVASGESVHIVRRIIRRLDHNIWENYTQHHFQFSCARAKVQYCGMKTETSKHIPLVHEHSLLPDSTRHFEWFLSTLFVASGESVHIVRRIIRRLDHNIWEIVLPR